MEYFIKYKTVHKDYETCIIDTKEKEKVSDCIYRVFSYVPKNTMNGTSYLPQGFEIIDIIKL